MLRAGRWGGALSMVPVSLPCDQAVARTHSGKAFLETPAFLLQVWQQILGEQSGFFDQL